MKGIATIKNKIGKVSILAALIFAAIGLPMESFGQLPGENRYYPGIVDQPKVPVLSLSGSNSGYDEDWYPDGVIYTPPSMNGKKYIYVPVFIKNEWERKDLFTDPALLEFDADPIESFEFSILYLSEALKPVGIETEHPEVFTVLEKPGTENPCDAKDWHISYSFEETDLYKTYIEENIDQFDRRNGRRLRISGVTGGQPLPTHSTYRILLYVKFEVVVNYDTGAPAEAKESVLIIHNDEIKYNDVDVTDAPPFIQYKDYLESNTNFLYADFYNEDTWPTRENTNRENEEFVKDTWWNVVKPDESPNPTDEVRSGQINNAYLAGMSNFDENDRNSITDPILPGMMYVKILEGGTNTPTLGFGVEGASGNEVIETVTANVPFIGDVPVEYELVDPITDIACETNQSPELPKREVELLTFPNGRRVENVIIETSAPWLQVETNSSKGLDFIPNRTNYDIIDYIDNGTLDPRPGNETPEGDFPQGEPGKIVVDVTCDPDLLPEDPEFEGEYIGYVTLSGDNFINSPVRLKVKFRYFRAPREGRGVPGSDCGVRLTVENSNNPVEAANLIFGTADRASDEINPLFGEKDADGPLSGFGARFYLKDRFNNDIFDDPDYAPYGLTDIAPNALEPAYDSRDIRNVDDTTESIIYHVKFNENGDANYPITVSWDTRDFLEGAQYFIRDVITDGTPRLFPSVNMRTANNPSDQPPYIRTFTINDQRINEFIIEYTLSDVIEYVDEDGNPIIQEGWNFLSLPVKPVNNRWTNIYRNAINEPIYFIPNTYLSEENLRVGRGYFIKYSTVIDTRFAGSSITEISRDLQDSTRLYPGEAGEGGWNTIGALSVPTCIEGISFEPLEGLQVQPDPEYTRKFGVWRYNTRRGYEEVSELLPGLGYFIKVNENGYYRLENANCKTKPTDVAQRESIYSNSELIRIKDSKDHNGEIYISRDKNIDITNYEMPPKPPVQVFDARFNTNTKLVNTDESILNLQGVEYPLNLEVEYASANYTFTDALTGRILGSVKRGESKTIEINSTATNSIKINSDIPEFNGDVSVYPNPVSDFMSIEYNNSIEGNVNISLYNVVGLKVADLFNGTVSEGTQNLKVDQSVFDLNTLAEGRYILQITTMDGNLTAMVNIVRR